VKKAIVLSLLVMCLASVAPVTAWAGPTVTLESLWYGDDWQMVWGAGISYVSDQNWGAFGEFKFVGIDYSNGEDWHFALIGIPDIQLTYDIPLYTVAGEDVLIVRPGLGVILPFQIGSADEVFACAITDPGLAASVALVIPYDITIRGEAFFNTQGVSWGLGLTVDWFGLSELFRGPTPAAG